MAKTYIDTVKYVVNADFEIKGSVEKPDIIGAIFGQTEGLLGDQLDLRELQKSGRVGRIEVKPKSYKGKTSGDITLPSSLDRVETSIIAAALETVDRIGPCEARIKVKSVEDTRTKKRQDIIDRAKQILKTMVEKNIPESKELSEMVRDEVKTAEVINWGPDKLPSGPGIEESENILVVEGRADVLTLLRADITNVTSLQGKNIPKSVVDLSHKKTITLFVDGDRGGDLIVKNFMETGGEADFVCKAPDGKEVEELTQKEILKSLRRKIPVQEFLAYTFKEGGNQRHSRHPRPDHHRRPEPTRTRPEPTRAPPEKPNVAPPTKNKEMEALEEELNRLSGTLKATILDKDMKTITEMPVKDLTRTLEKEKKAEAVVLDGIVTQRLIDTAEKQGVKYIVGVKQGTIKNTGKVAVFTAE